MATNPLDTWSLEEDDSVTVSLEDALSHDEYWARAYRGQSYYRAGLDYEDYAPAYCVGYTGRAQYGDDFEHAEKSMVANWLRIKGDSRLGLDEARAAIRAAWDHAAAPAAATAKQRGLPSWLDEMVHAAEGLVAAGQHLLQGIQEAGLPRDQPAARFVQREPRRAVDLWK
ncbi:MAG: hypothetical protein HY854_00380 [Burkholderiales bacterium]|nr:hypothetical protein [Burkholderiales bacterium]